MRALLLVVLLLAPAALVAAQAPDTRATLDVQVQADRTERMTLTFDGLERLTRYRGLCLPAGARESRVHDELGDLPYEGADENGRRVLSFAARSPRVVIDMARGAPNETERPLYAADVNFCVPQDSLSVIRVTVPERHDLFFVSDGGRIEGRTGVVEREGALHAFYTYEAPLAPTDDLVVFEEGPFRVFVPRSSEEQAREVAALARAPFEAAADEAGLLLPFDKLRILYVHDSEQAWEAGHYDGKGFVSIRVETLAPDPTEGYPFTPVRVVVHEGFHALSFPFGKGRVEETISWWLEGTARHAEQHVRDAMPNASRYCVTEGLEARCWDFDDRIRRADLETAYSANFTFQEDWEPKLPQSDETRSFHYGLSELVVGAWIERHGVAAYREAYDEILATFADDTRCPCRAGWLRGVLAEAGGGADEDLFTPWIDLKQRVPSSFDARIAPFVRDEAALQRELDAHAKAAIPKLIPSAGALVAVAAFALALGRRRA